MVLDRRARMEQDMNSIFMFGSFKNILEQMRLENATLILVPLTSTEQMRKE